MVELNDSPCSSDHDEDSDRLEIAASAGATVSVTNVVTHNHICRLTPFNVEVTFMFMDWSAKSNRQKQH